MLKDIAISILGAMVLSRHPWLQSNDMRDKIAIIVGLAVVLFIFLLFLEEIAEKVRRVRKLKKIMERVRNMEVIPDAKSNG